MFMSMSRILFQCYMFILQYLCEGGQAMLQRLYDKVINKTNPDKEQVVGKFLLECAQYSSLLLYFMISIFCYFSLRRLVMQKASLRVLEKVTLNRKQSLWPKWSKPWRIMTRTRCFVHFITCLSLENWCQCIPLRLWLFSIYVQETGESSTSNTGVTISSKSHFPLIQDPVTILHPLHGSNDPLGLIRTLEELQPTYVILYDADITFVRQLEVGCAQVLATHGYCHYILS